MANFPGTNCICSIIFGFDRVHGQSDIQCMLDIVATLGHSSLATISNLNIIEQIIDVAQGNEANLFEGPL